jgi:hypothetical protein
MAWEEYHTLTEAMSIILLKNVWIMTRKDSGHSFLLQLNWKTNNEKLY